MIVRRPLAGSLLFGLMALIASSDPREAIACGTAYPRNKPVEIADESAIIVWDAATKTQHFIRRASFRTAADDFGFLVPTPTQPILAEASEAAFTLLAKVTAPKTIERTVSAIKPACGGRGGSKYAGDVNVLESKRVAGYDAAVLESDNADALVRWLQDHNYDYSPALKEWLEPYVAAKWIVTAFKVARYDAKDPQTATSAVRMSFRTERPFFPYREPKKDSETYTVKRFLRVFFVGDTRVDGELGETGAKWIGKPVWSNRLKPETRTELLGELKLPESAAPAEAVLTEFEDRSTPRPGTADVFFSPSKSRGTVEREPNIEYVERFWSSETAGVGLLCCAPPLLMLLGCMWGFVLVVRFCWRKWNNARKTP